jgi:hypothetical protein
MSRSDRMGCVPLIFLAESEKKRRFFVQRRPGASSCRKINLPKINHL